MAPGEESRFDGMVVDCVMTADAVVTLLRLHGIFQDTTVTGFTLEAFAEDAWELSHNGFSLFTFYMFDESRRRR